MNRHPAGLTVHPDDQRQLRRHPASLLDRSSDRDDVHRADDVEEEAPVPNLERLVADAMALAAAAGGTGAFSGASSRLEPADLADLVNRFWRLIPDEDLVGHTSADMLSAVSTHLDLAGQRLPGEMKLAVERTADRTAILV